MPNDNPIVAQPGELQQDVEPELLRPSRAALYQTRLEFQRKLLQAGTERYTPIRVTAAGVIYDGHYAVRAAAEAGRKIEVLVVDADWASSAENIFDLPIR